MADMNSNPGTDQKPANPKRLEKLVESHKLEEAMEHSMGLDDDDSSFERASKKSASSTKKDYQGATNAAKSTAKKAKSKANEKKDELIDQAKDTGSQLQSGFQKAYKQLGELSENLPKAAEEYRSQVTSYAKAQGQVIERRIHERPLTYVAAGVIIGFALGRLGRSRSYTSRR